MSSTAGQRSNRPLAWFLVVLALLVISGLLVALPTVGSPSAGDVCNAPSQELKDQIAAEKNRRASVVVAGAAVSFVAAVVAFVAAARRRWRWWMVLLGLVGVAGSGAGLLVALLTALIVC